MVERLEYIDQPIIHIFRRRVCTRHYIQDIFDTLVGMHIAIAHK